MGGRGYSENHSTKWGTQIQNFFDLLDSVYHFTLDPCTEPNNPLNIPQFFTEQQDGLKQPWSGRVFCNPPYGGINLKKWFQKCFEEWKKGCCEYIVLLAPVRGFDAKRHHEYICKCEGNPDPVGSTCNGWREGIEVRFIAGRLKFKNLEKADAPVQAGTFGSMIIIFKGPDAKDLKQVPKFQDLTEVGLHL